MSPQPENPTDPNTAAHAADREAVWQPRQASAADSVAQYSRFVAAMKIVLPVTAGLLLLLVIVLPQLRQDDERFRIGMNLIKGSNTDVLNMTNARYYGTDDKGQPYSVTAEGVRQRSNTEKSVDLVQPKAEINLTNGNIMQAAAGAGTYDRDNQKLDLSGGVTVTQNENNHLRTATAEVMLKEGSASGTAPVAGDGPYGTMEAQGGFDLSERGQTVHFHGKSHLVLNPRSALPAPAPAAPVAPSTGAHP